LLHDASRPGTQHPERTQRSGCWVAGVVRLCLSPFMAKGKVNEAEGLAGV